MYVQVFIIWISLDRLSWHWYWWELNTTAALSGCYSSGSGCSGARKLHPVVHVYYVNGWNCWMNQTLCAHHVAHHPHWVFLLTGDIFLPSQDSHLISEIGCLAWLTFSLITYSVAPPPPPSSSSLFATTTGKTTPTSASTTYHGATFPKEAGDPERGTGAGGPPPARGQGSPDSEPISVEMEGKGRDFLYSVNLQGDCTAESWRLHCTLLTRLTTNKKITKKFHSSRTASCFQHAWQ